MKKTILSLFIAIFAISWLTACSGYNIDKDLAPDKKAQYEQTIEENSAELEDTATEDSKKINLYRDIAVAYERLGKYDQAIEYYEKTLELDPQNFVALNNLTAIYEEVGELKLAASYVVTLYTHYKSQPGVVDDTIRILVKNGGFEDAKMVITEFAQDYATLDDTQFVSDQFDYIARMQKKAQEEGEDVE